MSGLQHSLTQERKQARKRIRNLMKRRWQMYVMMLLPIVFIILFKYAPMGGLAIAFKDFSLTKGIAASKWVGLKYFEKFLNSYMFPRLMSNTLILSLYSIVVGFPIPILLAIFLNECQSARYRKLVQMVSYAPHFITTVVIVSILSQLFNYHRGIVNVAIRALGGKPIDFMGEAGYFRTMYVLSDVWQNMGYNSIIYAAALASVDPQLEEACVIDGANRIQKIIHIDIPSILPTIIILLILRTGSVLSVGYEKVYLMQNDVNIIYSEVISTYVYQTGLLNTQYSLASAIGIFNSVINLSMIVLVNTIARKVSDIGLW